MDKNLLIPCELLKKGIEPFPFQWDGIKTLVQKNRFLLADEPGLGKTIQLITAANWKARELGRTLRVLVICPKSMKITWRRELDKWGLDIYANIINHDQLLKPEIVEQLRAVPNDIVIADEVHLYLKNEETIRAKAFERAIEDVPVLWLATATLGSKSSQDYYLVGRLLMPDIFKKVSKNKYLNMFCEKEEVTFYSRKKVKGCRCKEMPNGIFECKTYQYVGFKNVDKLNKFFSVCSLKRREEQVKLQLPELTFTDYFADVNFKDLKHFTEEQAVSIVDNIVNDAFLGESFAEALQHNAMQKIPAVLEILKTYPKDKQIVIFAWHRKVIDALLIEIAKEVNESVAKITGEITNEINRQSIIDNFQAKKIKILLINMQSGGVGITLTAATVGIYIEFPYSATHWKQSMKRIHRIGSKEPVNIIRVSIPESLDERVYGRLQERLEKIKEIGL